ncbi:hypothetical protein DMENIID0001_099060 [Sergentomyia squamirostris]
MDQEEGKVRLINTAVPFRPKSEKEYEDDRKKERLWGGSTWHADKYPDKVTEIKLVNGCNYFVCSLCPDDEEFRVGRKMKHFSRSKLRKHITRFHPEMNDDLFELFKENDREKKEIEDSDSCSLVKWSSASNIAPSPAGEVAGPLLSEALKHNVIFVKEDSVAPNDMQDLLQHHRFKYLIAPKLLDIYKMDEASFLTWMAMIPTTSAPPA